MALTAAIVEHQSNANQTQTELHPIINIVLQKLEMI